MTATKIRRGASEAVASPRIFCDCITDDTQPKFESDNLHKLKVDKRDGALYMKIIEICLLSFGYRASSTAP